MWWVLLALVGCSRPDPDALFRRHDLDGAADAWAKLHGERPDVDHRVMDILALRAGRDPFRTFADALADLRAVRLLEKALPYGNDPLDVGFEAPSDLLRAAERIMLPGGIAAVGRSETGLDRDVYTTGALPWSRGRLVGWGPPGLDALGTSLDQDPPARLVTFAFEDETGWFHLSAEHRPDGWWTINATWAPAAGRLVEAADWGRTHGWDSLPARYGRGFIVAAEKPATP